MVQFKSLNLLISLPKNGKAKKIFNRAFGLLSSYVDTLYKEETDLMFRSN